MKFGLATLLLILGVQSYALPTIVGISEISEDKIVYITSVPGVMDGDVQLAITVAHPNPCFATNTSLAYNTKRKIIDIQLLSNFEHRNFVYGGVQANSTGQLA